VERNTPPSCTWDLLKEHGFIGSKRRLGNPYDNPQAESLMKTLKVEDMYLMEYETFEDVALGVPRFIKAYNERRLHCAQGYLSPVQFENRNTRAPVKTAAWSCLPPGAHSTIRSRLLPRHDAQIGATKTT
jgi:putative transposase